MTPENEVKKKFKGKLDLLDELLIPKVECENNEKYTVSTMKEENIEMFIQILNIRQ